MAGFFQSKKGKKIMAMTYGLGGAVVILGALFKIQHWPGAGPMLIAGLGTEAVIFTISAFEPPHEDLDWSLVYPELAHIDDEDIEGIEGGHTDRIGTVSQQLDGMLEEAKIGPELIESLGAGMKSIAEQANSLSETTKVGSATGDYVSSMQNASSKVDELSEQYAKASEALTGLSVSNEDSSTYSEHLQKLNSNLSSLNSVYEMQLQESNNQAKTSAEMYNSIGALMTNLSDSVEDTKRYKEEIAKLGDNLTALNNVYGNMLSAMKVNG